MPQALDGFRILDLTHVLAGPFCTYQLGLMGAQVIKIEEPGAGDYMRGRGADEALRDALMGDHFQCQNANKRSLAVDLHRPEGADIVRRLAAGSDVVVENYRTGVMERLGLGPDDLCALNPRLVHCRITAYGGDGPMGGRPAYDNVVQAMSGLMAATGTPDSGPLKAGAPVLDYATGTMAAMAILAALLRRERFGQAQRLDVSMLDTALMLMTPAVTSLLHAGRQPQPHGNDHALAAASCYEAADGELIMLGACTQRQFESLCHLIGRADLLADPRFAQVRRQDPHRAALAGEIGRTMTERTASAWERLLADKVPAARVRTLAETMSLPQLASRRVIGDFSSDTAAIQTPLAAFIADADGPTLDRPPPTLGADGTDILRELGLTVREIETLIASKVLGAG